MVLARIGSDEQHGLVKQTYAIGLVCDATTDEETAWLAAYDTEDSVIALVRRYDRSLAKDHGMVVKDVYRADHYLASFQTDDDVTQGPYALIELQMEVEYQR